MRTVANIFFGSLALLVITTAAHADYVSRTYSFDLSDALPYGESFGSAMIEAYDGVGPGGGGLAAGQLRMTFHAAPLPIYGPVDSSFGIQQLGFNSKLDIKDAQIQLPAGWKVRNDRFMGGFGKFRWQAYGDPSVLGGPLAITIDGLGADATVESFLVESRTSTGDWPLFGSVYFASRIGGFDLNNDFFDLSSHVAGTSVLTTFLPEELGPTSEPPAQTPEPASCILALCGAGAFVGWRRYRQFTSPV